VEPASSPSTPWFIDSGATAHVTSDINNFSLSSLYTGTDEIHMEIVSGLKIHNFGSTTIHTTEKLLLLSNILNVPEITKNLLSISQLTRDNDIIVELTHSSYFVKDRATNNFFLHGTLLNDLYQLNIQLTNKHVLHTD
jgi:hypothetical protein